LDVAYDKRDIAAKMQEQHNKLVKSGADMTSEAIKKEFPDYKVILLQPKSRIPAKFDYDRITLTNHEGIARSVIVG
jgi:hypothetical protein